MTVKRSLIVGLGVFGFMLAALSVAWACTSQSAIFDVSNSAPVPGETVTVQGLEFHANAVLEMRWGSADGPVIATAVTGHEEYDRKTADATRNYGVDRGTFSVAVTIPADAAPGTHQLYAIDPAGNWRGGIGIGSAALAIPGETRNEALAESELWDEAPMTETPAESPAEGTPEPAPGNAPATELPATAPAAAPVPAAPAPAAESPAAVAPAPAAPAPVAAAPAAEPATSEPVPAGTAAVAEPEPEPEPAFAPATAADWRYSHGAHMHTEPAPAPVEVDMEWRYSHGALMHTAATPEGTADEWVAAPQAAATPEGTPGLGAGFGLLAIGLVVLFGGFAIATVARRKEEVTVDGR